MKEIFEQYGPAIVAFVVIIAFVGLMIALIGTDEKSVVGAAFQQLLNQFFTKANGLLP